MEPVRLLREVVLVERWAKGTAQLEDSTQELEEARAIARAFVESREVPRLERRQIRALVRLYAKVDNHRARQLLLDLLLQVKPLGWRKLWALWERTPVDSDDHRRSKLIERIVARLTSRMRANPRFEKRRMPAWLPRQREAMREALAHPRQPVLDYIQQHGIRLEHVGERLGLSVGAGVGLDCVTTAIRESGPHWWQAQGEAEQVRMWAEDRPVPIVAAVADRQLCEHGRGVHGPAGITPNPPLQAWVTNKLGDNPSRSAAWQSVSDRGRQIFQWLQVHASFTEILNSFRSMAERDRFEFWRHYFDCIEDARFVTAEDVAVCLMVMRDTLIIEFGRTGNAAYIYEAPGFPLSEIPISEGRSLAFFKKKWGFDVGSERVTYLRSVWHQSGWEDKLRDYLRHTVGVRDCDFFMGA